VEHAPLVYKVLCACRYLSNEIHPGTTISLYTLRALEIYRVQHELLPSGSGHNRPIFPNIQRTSQVRHSDRCWWRQSLCSSLSGSQIRVITTPELGPEQGCIYTFDVNKPAGRHISPLPIRSRRAAAHTRQASVPLAPVAERLLC
jgi:hypothetical protein